MKKKWDLVDKFLRANFSCVVLGAILVLNTGCLRRSFTPSYSDRIEDWDSENPSKPISITEANSLFRSVESNSREQLKSLVTARSTSALTESLYRIGVADKLEMQVFDVPELSGTLVVNEAGLVSVPVVGMVSVRGLTIDEAKAALMKALSVPLKKPDIALTILEFGSQRVAVLGAVTRPGSFPLKKGISSFSELLAEAGGLSERAGNFVQVMPSEETGIGARNEPADRSMAALRAKDSGIAPHGIEVPAAELLGWDGALPLDIPLRGGDVIIVPEAGKVTVDGEVLSRGAFEVQPGMTVMGAVAAAGGITYSANLDEFELIRRTYDGASMHLVLNVEKIMDGQERDVLVKSGDIVRVPSLASRRIRQDTFDHISQFFNFGLSGALRTN